MDDPRQTLKKLGIRPSKGWGQHFLRERWVVQRIVDELRVQAGETIVEVGPGLGMLTRELLGAGATLRAIEIDERLAAHLEATFANESLVVITGDARWMPITSIVPESTRYCFAANLPYSVAPVIVRHFLESDNPPDRSAIMVQREVAMRIAATPPNMAILSIAMQVFASTRIAFNVSSSAFEPPPKVDSSVVILERLPEPMVPAGEQPRFFEIVAAGFRQKRKQLVNALSDGLGMQRETIAFNLEIAGIDPSRRAQTLSIAEWRRLVDELNDRGR